VAGGGDTVAITHVAGGVAGGVHEVDGIEVVQDAPERDLLLVVPTAVDPRRHDERDGGDMYALTGDAADARARVDGVELELAGRVGRGRAEDGLTRGRAAARGDLHDLEAPRIE